MIASWIFPNPPQVAVITTRSIVDRGAWIAHVTHDADDGGWQFHDGEVPGERDAMVVSLRSMVRLDATLTELADLPAGWHAWRDTPTGPWQRAAPRGTEG